MPEVRAKILTATVSQLTTLNAAFKSVLSHFKPGAEDPSETLKNLLVLFVDHSAFSTPRGLSPIRETVTTSISLSRLKLAENEESISICEICLATSPIAVHIACTHPSLLARGSLSAGLVSIRPLIVHDAYTAGFTDLERSHAAMRLAAEDRVAALASTPSRRARKLPGPGAANPPGRKQQVEVEVDFSTSQTRVPLKISFLSFAYIFACHVHHDIFFVSVLLPRDFPHG